MKNAENISVVEVDVSLNKPNKPSMDGRSQIGTLCCRILSRFEWISAKC